MDILTPFTLDPLFIVSLGEKNTRIPRYTGSSTGEDFGMNELGCFFTQGNPFENFCAVWFFLSPDMSG